MLRTSPSTKGWIQMGTQIEGVCPGLLVILHQTPPELTTGWKLIVVSSSITCPPREKYKMCSTLMLTVDVGILTFARGKIPKIFLL